jgi:hypothetical protein
VAYVNYRIVDCIATGAFEGLVGGSDCIFFQLMDRIKSATNLDVEEVEERPVSNLTFINRGVR